MTGDWALTYDDTLAVEIKLGGVAHTARIGTEGGSITIDHDGKPITFDLDCARPVVCPSEVWPAEVAVSHKNENRPEQLWVAIPKQTCTGDLVEPASEACGRGTNNPDCDRVCDGTTETETRGASDGDHWEATAMTNGEVVTAYAGGCLWAADEDMDGELEALVLGASVKLRTGFVGERK